MEPIEFIAPWYYSTYFYIFFLLCCWITVVYYIGSNGQKLLYNKTNGPSQVFAVLVTVVWAVMIGLRQIARDFGDMRGYAGQYKNMILDFIPINLHEEWFWGDLQVFCKTLGMNVHEFFLLVAFIYFGGMLICSIYVVRKNLWLAMLFFFTAFQTFTFATNGIRNGMACSLVLIALAIMSEKKKLTFPSALLMFLAFGTHRSTLLPSVATIASLYFIKDTKIALRFWIASIAISLVTGHAVENFFAALGFDDRMSSYSAAQYDEDVSAVFSGTGFRWDFLLYSMAPVVMVWYVTRRRRFNDLMYNVIANTYLLCNAFWIMVIRAAFSNRFAYLSWFLYPVVIFYPLFRMNIWKDQDRRTALVLFFYSGFTFFMFFIYYFGTTGFRGFDQYWWRE